MTAREIVIFRFMPYQTTLGVGSWKPPGINPTFAFCYVTGLAPSKYGSTHFAYTFVPLVKKNCHKETFLFICQHQSVKLTYVLEYLIQKYQISSERFFTQGLFGLGELNYIYWVNVITMLEAKSSNRPDNLS